MLKVVYLSTTIINAKPHKIKVFSTFLNDAKCTIFNSGPRGPGFKSPHSDHKNADLKRDRHFSYSQYVDSARKPRGTLGSSTTVMRRVVRGAS